MDLKSQLFELADGHGLRMFGLSDAATLIGCGSDVSRANPLQLSNFASFWILPARFR